VPRVRLGAAAAPLPVCSAGAGRVAGGWCRGGVNGEVGVERSVDPHVIVHVHGTGALDRLLGRGADDVGPRRVECTPQGR